VTVWNRVGGASGLVFVALYFTAFFWLQNLDSPAAGSASAAEIREFIAQESLPTALAALASMVAWAAFLWFIGSIRSPVASEGQRRLEWVAASAGILLAGLSLANVALRSEVVLHDPTADDATLLAQWALYDASGGLSGITPLLRATFVGALSIVAMPNGGPMRWLGWFGLLVATANVLGGIDYSIAADWSLTIDPLFDLIAFMAWVLGASVLLLVRGLPARGAARES